METMKAIKTRRSVRKYKSDSVPKERIEQVIEAGLRAATGKNHQSAIIIAVTNAETRAELVRANCEIGSWQDGFDPFYGAPVILIVLDRKDWYNHVYDGSLVLGNMMLAAHELGLGSCWIHRAREEFEQGKWQAWLKKLGIEDAENYEGIGHLALGFPEGNLPEPKRIKEGRVFWVE